MAPGRDADAEARHGGCISQSADTTPLQAAGGKLPLTRALQGTEGSQDAFVLG